MTTLAHWIAGARPRTLPAALSPVIVGGSIAYLENGDAFNPWLLLASFVVALALQVGVNYSNDYSDGIRGTDDQRVGPVRLVGQKLAEPHLVKRAAFLSFGSGAIAGLAMVAMSHFYILIPVGISAIIAAWFYTGGTRPYGYAGLGEVFVFIYFGLVAVVGTSASQSGHISAISVLGGVGCGCLSTAILVVNNIRDIPNDTLAGKNTLAVKLGDSRSRSLFIALLVTAMLVVVVIALISNNHWSVLAITAFVFAWQPLTIIRRGDQGRDLIPALAGTGKLLLIYGLALGLGLLLGR